MIIQNKQKKNKMIIQKILKSEFSLVRHKRQKRIRLRQAKKRKMITQNKQKIAQNENSKKLKVKQTSACIRLKSKNKFRQRWAKRRKMIFKKKQKSKKMINQKSLKVKKLPKFIIWPGLAPFIVLGLTVAQSSFPKFLIMLLASIGILVKRLILSFC